jgi:hypothetical protein
MEGLQIIIERACEFKHGSFRDFWSLIRPLMTDEDAERFCELIHVVFDAGFSSYSRFADPVLAEKLQRYGYLAGKSQRTDDEETEVHELLKWLRGEDSDPGWEPVARQGGT